MRTDEAMAVEDLHATLRGEIDALNKSHADLARRLADAGRKIESDAKVIAALREALSALFLAPWDHNTLAGGEKYMAAAELARKALADEQTAGEKS